MSRLRVEPEAQAELREAARWYERREPGLSRELLDEVEAVLDVLVKSPYRFPVIIGLDVPVEVRRASLHRFPYHVLFLVASGEVVVVAVAHARRRPGYWLGRLTGKE